MKKNLHYLYIFLIGLLFGFGLVFSGMIYPEKVIGFLNIFGVWDPSLIFVMLGGILVYSIFYFAFKKSKYTVLNYEKNIPLKKELDKNLIIGSILFGIGWGLAGFCPGPGIVGVGIGNINAIIFVTSMIIGMLTFNQYQSIKTN